VILDQPSAPLPAALILAAKSVFGTELTTAELRQLAAAIRAQSFFSAQTTDEHLLDLYQARIGGILHPVPAEGGVTTPFNPAYVRQAVKDILRETGYQPDTELRGTIQDLSSNARINLVIKTNVEMAQGQGLWMQTQEPALLDEWPAWELFRAEARVKVRDWLNRFRQAGAASGNALGHGWIITPDERMIALKNHPIWDELGSSDNFNDALDTSWPPFAFNSGMWVRDVDRGEVEKLGLLQRNQQVQPRSLADAQAAMSKTLAQEVAA